MVRAALFLGFFLASVVPGRAQAPVQDQFTTKNHPKDGVLDKTSTETSGKVWEATQNVLVTNSGKEKGVVIADENPFAGRVAVPPQPKLIVVEAKLRPQPVGDQNWVAIGIGDPVLGTPPWGKGVFIYVVSNGTYGLSCATDPADIESTSVVSLQSGNVPNFSPDDPRPVSVKLQYDVKTEKVSAWVNTVAVATDVSVAGKVKVAPAFAGFSGYGQKPNTTTVASFSLTLK